MSELDYSIVPTGGNAVASATIRLTAADVKALRESGNPAVEFGGQVTATINLVATPITLPTNVQPVVDGLRVSTAFKTQTNIAENIAFAQAWIAQITTAVNAALVLKRSQHVAISGTLADINTI